MKKLKAEMDFTLFEENLSVKEGDVLLVDDIEKVKVDPSTKQITLTLKRAEEVKNATFNNKQLVKEDDEEPSANAEPPIEPSANAEPPIEPGANAEPPIEPSANAEPPIEPGANAEPPIEPGASEKVKKGSKK